MIAIYAVEDQPIPYLVMDYIAGRTLQQKLDATGPLELLDVLRIGRQIAAGLAAAHAMGLIHRDIKPANILLKTVSSRSRSPTSAWPAPPTTPASRSRASLPARRCTWRRAGAGRAAPTSGPTCSAWAACSTHVQRPAAVPGREHDGRAQAGGGRHASPDS